MLTRRSRSTLAPVIWKTLLAGVMSLVGVLALTASAAADVHNEGGGRLSASSGSGGFIAYAPVHRPYWVSGGEWILCDTMATNGTVSDPPVITGVRHIAGKSEPLEVRTYLRTVTPEQVASHPDSPRYSYSPFISKVGRPRFFGQRYVDPTWRPRGSYSTDIAGTVVADGCEQARTDARADGNGEVPEHPWMSLVLSVKVGPDAGRVRRTLVDYVVGDVPHTLCIRWVFGGKGYEQK